MCYLPPVLPARAQEAALSLQPPATEILLSQNKSIIQTFTLKNQGEKSNFVINIHGITPTDSAGHVTISPTPLSLADFPLSLSLQNADLELGKPFTLESGDNQQIVLSLRSPNLDSSQDLYFALVATNESKVISSQTVSQAGIAALVFVTLSPDGLLPMDLSVQDFDLPLVMDSTQKLSLNPTVTNHSAVMIRPEGVLEITSPRGSNDLKLNLYPHLVLGNSSRLMKAMVKPNDPPTRIEYAPTLRNIGPYRFRLTLLSPGGKELTTIEKTVWILPIKLTIIVISILFIYVLYSHRSQRARTIDTTLQSE